MFGPLAPHARLLFRGGLVGGLGSFALYLVAGNAMGGEVLDRSILSPILVGGAFLGGIATLLGALAMPPALPLPPERAAEETPTEAYLRLAERAEAWISRARRYIIIGGIFGGIVWIPLMLFGLFAGPSGDASRPVRFLALGGSFAFAAVAVLWWRRVMEIDRELRAWRTRVSKLRAIEADLLAEP